MDMYEKMDELRAHSGVGSCLYAQNTSGKYSIFMPLESAPNVSSTPSSIDVDVTSSDTVTKAEGKTTLEEKEVQFLWHRDNIRRLEKYAGKQINFLLVNSDYTASKFTGSVSYKQDDSSGGDLRRGTIKITPSKYDGVIDNCYDILQKTVKFVSPIEPTIHLDSETTEYVQLVETNPTDATVTAKSENEAIATASYSEGKVTITRVKEGSTVVTLTGSKSGMADWETTIHVACE